MKVVMSHILQNPIHFMQGLGKASKILIQVCSPPGRESKSGPTKMLATQPRCTIPW
jgi:hypothetical protein